MFPGTCREALAFYEGCFEGTITMMQTFEESSLDVPEGYDDKIFNSEFRSGDLVLMASDVLPGNEMTAGNNIALFVTFTKETELLNTFNKLSAGGRILFPVEENFGMLVDTFGIQWMLEYKNESQTKRDKD
jgi:PhnB protein